MSSLATVPLEAFSIMHYAPTAFHPLWAVGNKYLASRILRCCRSVAYESEKPRNWPTLANYLPLLISLKVDVRSINERIDTIGARILELPPTITSISLKFRSAPYVLLNCFRIPPGCPVNAWPPSLLNSNDLWTTHPIGDHLTCLQELTMLDVDSFARAPALRTSMLRGFPPSLTRLVWDLAYSPKINFMDLPRGLQHLETRESKLSPVAALTLPSSLTSLENSTVDWSTVYALPPSLSEGNWRAKLQSSPINVENIRRIPNAMIALKGPWSIDERSFKSAKLDWAALLPKNLTELHLHRTSLGTEDIIDLPRGITRLEMVTLRTDEMSKHGGKETDFELWPPALTYLCLDASVTYNKHLFRFLPSSLLTLVILGTQPTHSVSDLPYSLTSLELHSSWKSNSLPKFPLELTSLTLPNANFGLKGWSTLPRRLTSLTLGATSVTADHADESLALMPPTVTHLRLRFATIEALYRLPTNIPRVLLDIFGDKKCTSTFSHQDSKSSLHTIDMARVRAHAKS